MIANPGGEETHNTISGGTQQGPVLMGRDFRNVHIGDVVQSAAAPLALAQLPPLVAGFAGRDAELAEITALLDPTRDTEAVVVSAVAGLAGVGKTALAIQAAHAARQAGWFPGGVLFIDLHGYDDVRVEPGQALDALLRALGISSEHIPPGIEERGGLYRSALAQISDPVLIIADNTSAQAQVKLLLPGPGPHRVVITSRHTLAGLGARLLDVTILHKEAGMMLLDRAMRTARPADDRIIANRVGAARLVGLCGGLPLALQITAALLKADPSKTVGDLTDDLANELWRLETLRYDDGKGTSAPSVAAAFELSYRHLDEAAARVFRLLPVNPAPDISTMAVIALADQPGKDVRDAVGRLVRAHLVEAVPGVANRWRMHDLLRLYARQLSDADAHADEREQARDRLLDYYADIALVADAHIRALPGTPVPSGFTNRENALAWLDDERPSLIAAVTMAANTGRDQIALRLPLQLAEYLPLRRRFDDLLSITMVCRDAAQRLSDRANEAVARINLGAALQGMYRFEDAVIVLREAVAILREIGERHAEGIALVSLSNALRQVGRFEEAIAAHQDSASIFRETRDRQGEGMALENLGLALREAGRTGEAIAALQESVSIFREIGDTQGEGTALADLGDTLENLGQFKEAIATHQDAATILRETGDRHGEGRRLLGLGTSLLQAGQFEEAVPALQDSAAIFPETGDRRGEAMALLALGLALWEAGRTGEAIAARQDSAAIFREIGDPHGEGIALDGLESDQAEQQT